MPNTLDTVQAVSGAAAGALAPTNLAPTGVVLTNTSAGINENTATVSHIRVADIVVIDDALGTNTLGLTGADAAFFEIEGASLYLKAGTVLDYETKTSYSVAITVDDSFVGATPDATSAPYTLAVGNVVDTAIEFALVAIGGVIDGALTPVNSAPTAVVLTSAVASVDENTATASHIKVADIAAIDDALGTNVLGLTGADASFFEIVGSSLYLKAGTVLDFETKDSYSVAVTVDDTSVGGTPDAASTTYTLTVNDVNEAPVAQNGTAAGNEDTPINGTLTATDVDNTAAQLTYSRVANAAHGSVTVHSDGTFTYTPGADFNGNDSFTFKANDGAADSNTATIILTVAAVNDAPTPSANTGATVNEGASTVISNAQLGFNDVDNTDAQITFALSATPAHGMLLRNGAALMAGGSFTQADIANNLLRYAHDGSETTSDAFAFSVSDGIAPAIAGQSFALTITPQNDAPQITSNGGGAAATISVPENETTATAVTASDPDGPSLAFSIVGGIDAAKFAIDDSTGVLGFISAPDFELPGDFDANNSYVVKLRVSDGLASDDQTITVNVTDVRPEHGAANDFNADHVSDVLLGQSSSGIVAEWSMAMGQIGENKGVGSRNADFHPDAPGISQQWHFQDTGDFNADGRADVLWRHDNGQVVLWSMNGSQIVSNQSVATIGSDWHNEGVGDFNGDGKADVLWHNNSGQIALWTMDGAQITGNQQVAMLGSGWHFQGLLDANGDDRSDVLLRNDSGQVVLWTMDGGKIIGNQSIANLGLDWHVAGTGDFKADGRDDVLLRNDSGQVVLWQMNGAQVESNTSIATPGNDWQVQDIGDYNHDGYSDILWRNDSGQVVIWEMNGDQIVSNHAVTSPGASLDHDWTILTHRYDLF